MTAVDDATRVDTTIDVDLDAPVACVYDGCVTPAVWNQRNGCPGRHSILVCDAHRAHEARFHEKHCNNVACKFCDAILPHPHADWVQL